jgi:uncharacterized membrane protein YeaQ/YmgE (transglycosylase-associated protein family)
MGLVTWILLGLLAGVIAKYVMPGVGPSGWILTTLLGMVGAVVGGIVGNFVGFGGVNSLTIGSLLLAVLGSILVLAGYRTIVKYIR